MAKLDIVAPRVNINGTSPDVLLEQQNDVVVALQAVLVALQAAWPHGRDYQGYAPEIFSEALGQAQGSLLLVEGLIAKHTAIGIAIVQQGEG